MGYLAGAPDLATKVELIKTLQGLTEGKVRAWGRGRGGERLRCRG